MTFAQLRIFVAVVEAGGFTTAAAQLGVGQSAVSHALTALERSLGVKLIDRRQTTLLPTDAGRRLLPYARDALAQADAMEQVAKAAKGLMTGIVRIGSFGPTSSLRLLPRLLSEYRRRFPGIEVHIDEGPDEVVDQWLIERRIDLGFVVLPDQRFDTAPLADDEYVLLLPSTHRLAAKSEVALADIADEPFALTRAGSGGDIEALFRQSGVYPRVLYRLMQLMSILGVVAQGFAVAIAARMALPERHPNVEYRSLRPRATRRLGLAAKSELELSPAARAFFEMARKDKGFAAAVGRRS